MNEELMFGVQLTVTGMTVVFSGLVLLFVLMTIFQRVDRWLLARSQSTDNTPSASDALPDHDGTVPPEIIPVIAAAVAVATGRQVRIRRIRYRARPAETSWSKEGRLTVMGSHRTRT